MHANANSVEFGATLEDRPGVSSLRNILGTNGLNA